jgi:hypothetical protein
MVTSGDKILVFILIVLSIFIYFGINKFNNVTGDYVVVSINGELYNKFPLKVNGVFNIEKEGISNTISIQDNSVEMIDANCFDKYCVRHFSLKNSNTSIICLPNKLVVEIESKVKPEFDAIAR